MFPASVINIVKYWVLDLFSRRGDTITFLTTHFMRRTISFLKKNSKIAPPPIDPCYDDACGTKSLMNRTRKIIEKNYPFSNIGVSTLCMSVSRLGEGKVGWRARTSIILFTYVLLFRRNILAARRRRRVWTNSEQWGDV